MKKKFDYISHTQMEVGKCLYRYNEVYNKKNKPVVESLALKTGRFKHRFAEEYVKFCIQSEQDSDPETMKKIFNELWPQYHITEENYQEIYNECLDFAEKNVNFQSVIDTEQRCRVEFEPGKFIEGIIDKRAIYKFRGIALKANDDILHIFDYKNTAQLLKGKEILTPQMRLYTFLSYHTLPKFQYYRRLIYFMKYNIIRAFEDEDDPTPLMDIEIEVQQTLEWIRREWKRIKEATEFPAITGSHCYQYDGCHLLISGECPKIKKKDFISIDEKVRKIFQMETQLKDLKKTAKEYITLNGNVTVDEKEVGWIPDTKETYPFEQAYNLVKENKYDLSEENFPSSIMKRFIKELKNKLEAKKILNNVEKIKEIEDKTDFKF